MITQEVSTKLKVSTKVIETNYFNYLKNILKDIVIEGNVTPVNIDEKICSNELSS